MQKEPLTWKYFDPDFDFNPEIPIESSPWGGHSFFAYDLVRNVQPALIVELGTYTGNSLFAFAQAIKDGEFKTELHGIDTWEGDKHSGFYGEELYRTFLRVKDKYYKGINIIPHKLFFDQALEKFEDNCIDILHIDGLHTYEAVKHDFETWLPKVNKENGIILLHDVREKRTDFGVYKLWEEIQKEYNTFTLEHYHGLGIVFMKNSFSEKYLNENLIKYYNFLEKELLLQNDYNNLKKINQSQEKQIKKITKENDVNKKSLELKEKELSMLLEEINEFRGFKKGMIWKTLKKYRKLKRSSKS